MFKIYELCDVKINHTNYKLSDAHTIDKRWNIINWIYFPHRQCQDI